MLYTADTVYDDIEDKAVGDFCSGCGILGIAANILGAG
jgi:predicted RNA methylase